MKTSIKTNWPNALSSTVSKSFCLTVPKHFIGEHFGVSEKIFLSKILMHRRGASRFCLNFLSHRTETKSFVKEPFCFPEIFWYQKNLWIRRGISRSSVEIFMSHSAEKFRDGILLFLRKFLGSKSFMDERGGVSRFSVDNFWSHSAEKIRGYPFNVSQNLAYRKILCKLGGITFFRQKFLVSQCRKISWASIPSMFQKIWGIEKIYA